MSGLECRDMICEVPYLVLGEMCEMTEQCEPQLECRDMVCEVPLVALNGACTMTN